MKLRVEHTSNSGLFIEIDGVKILVDAIFQETNYFNPMTSCYGGELYVKDGRYSGADILLFTHGHNDHYDYQMTRKYMNLNPDSMLIIPEGIMSCGGWNGVDLKSKRIKMIKNGRCGLMEVKGIEIYYYRTPHMEFDLNHFGYHYSFIIKKEDYSIFISGDTDLNPELIKILNGAGRINYAFFNPVVVQKKKSREMLSSMNIDKVFIYHLPLEEYDRFFYRAVTVRTQAVHYDEMSKVELLLGEMEECINVN